MEGKNLHGGISFSSVEWIYRFVRGDCCKSQQTHNLACKIV